MALDWAVISQAVQKFHDTKGWWPSQAEYDALVASLSAPAPAAAVAAAAAPITLGAGSDSLVLQISQDAWQGSAQYRVSVDGVQIGGVQTASALHGSGASDTVTVRGDWGAGAHQVKVEFLNDAWGGTTGTDRNLHIDGASYNGTALAGVGTTLWSAGAANFTFTEAQVAPPGQHVTAGSGPDTLELRFTETAWKGDAQFTVTVDGVQVGGVFTATAANGSGQVDTVTLKGDWSGVSHRVEVSFLNDAWGGGAGADRNLYLEGATYNGAEVPGAKLDLASTGTQHFTVVEPAPPGPGFAAAARWSDEFNGTALDSGKWPVTYGGGALSSNGAFRWDGSEVSVSGGALHLGLEKQANGLWDVGGVATTPTSWHPGFSFTYGKVEIMAKMSQEVSGSGPVFLLWPASNDHWPPEVDILETPKGNGMFTTHWAAPDGGDRYESSVFDLDYSQWHVYGLEWTPDRMTMTVDGKPMKITTENIPHEAMSIGLQGHVGNASEDWYGGSPNDSGVSRMDIAVDYVRVYDWLG